jgi:glycosidase
MFQLWMTLLMLCQAWPSEAPKQVEAPVVYGVSPYHISQGQNVKGLPAIEQRLPEIRTLGANVLWLMPVTPPAEPGEGYDVVDYEHVWTELGTEEDLQRLVSKAHALGLRVILDEVLNHSSRHHRFVNEILALGENSPYADFYQHQAGDRKGYGRFLHAKSFGACGTCKFFYYFWAELFNFNYDSPRLREYMFGMVQSWLQRFDLDGFRFDAAWAPSSRWSGFYKELSQRLRAVRSDVLLLAEDRAGYPEILRPSSHPHFENSSMDWGYDWRDGESISTWAFEIEDGRTVFNTSDAKEAAAAFLKGVQANQDSRVEVLRYLENNDTAGFRRDHTVAQTRFAAQVVYTLPGVPLLFYGQEFGSAHPQWELESLDPRRTLKSYGPEFFEFYRALLQHRRESSALSTGKLENLKRCGSTCVGFDRVSASERRRIRIDFAAHTVSEDGVFPK